MYKIIFMPELVIKYKDKRTLNVLMDLSKYFYFSISAPKSMKEEKYFLINGVAILSGNSTLDTSELEAIFSNKNLDAKTLREKAWQGLKN